MPPTAQFSDNANYVDTEIGAGAKLGVDTYNNVMSGATASGAARQFMDQVPEMHLEIVVLKNVSNAVERTARVYWYQRGI